jgi:hypothetical protein
VSFSIPITWKKLAFPGLNDTTLVGYTDGNAVLLIVKSSIPKNQPDFNINTLHNQLIAELGTSTKISTVTISGHQAFYGETKDFSQAKQTLIQQDFYEFIAGDQFYRISEMAPVSAFTADKSVFNSILQSIVIK